MTIHHLESLMMMKIKCQLDNLRSSKSKPRRLVQKIKGNFQISIQQEKCWAVVQEGMFQAVYIKKLEKREQ
jgi:hypothetical protein